MTEWYAILGLTGLALGSFLNVVIYRLPRKMSLFGPRSKCPGCDTQIKYYDNIPVLSFMMLKRRCRECGISISWRYPLVEVLTAMILIGLALHWGWSLEFVKFSILALLLISISFIDWDEKIIPNWITFTGFIIGVTITAVFQIEMWRLILLGVGVGLILPLFFMMLGKVIFKKDSVGMGDVKLLVMLGVYIGYQGVLFSFFVGAFIALIYIILAMTMKKLQFRDTIPFGPFIAISTVLYLFIGPDLIEWYFNFKLSGN